MLSDGRKLRIKKSFFPLDIISTFIVSDYNDHVLINGYYAYIPV